MLSYFLFMFIFNPLLLKNIENVFFKPKKKKQCKQFITVSISYYILMILKFEIISGDY